MPPSSDLEMEFGMKSVEEIILGPGWQDRWFGGYVKELSKLREENIQLRQELIEVQQRNDLFAKCTARALTLWQEKHPDEKMWPDTAENLCWLAEENERLRKILIGIAFEAAKALTEETGGGRWG